MFVKVNKKTIYDSVNWGFNKKFVVCQSNKIPQEDSCVYETCFFSDVSSFERWHKSMKTNMCNIKDGKSLKYYIMK